MVNIFKLFDKKQKKVKKTKFGEEILNCPRCEKEMDKIKRNEVIIDTCRRCGGLWLDKDEINKLVELRNKDKPFKKKNNP